MQDEDVKRVEKIVDENPLDSFWDPDAKAGLADDPNSVLFEDILKMLNGAGYDLILIRRKEPLKDVVERLFVQHCPEGTWTEEYLEKLDELDIGYMDEGSFGEYSSEELIDTFAGEQNKANAREWLLHKGMYYWRNLEVREF